MVVVINEVVLFGSTKISLFAILVFNFFDFYKKSCSQKIRFQFLPANFFYVSCSASLFRMQMLNITLNFSGTSLQMIVKKNVEE